MPFDKLFSNEKHCKQVESEIVFKKFIKGGIIDNENNIYYYEKNYENNDYYLKLELFDDNVIDYRTPNIQYIDKKQYIKIFKVPFESNNNYDVTEEIYIYEKECKKYEDIECICKNGVKKVDKNISNQYNNIIFYK